MMIPLLVSFIPIYHLICLTSQSSPMFPLSLPIDEENTSDPQMKTEPPKNTSSDVIDTSLIPDLLGNLINLGDVHIPEDLRYTAICLKSHKLQIADHIDTLLIDNWVDDKTGDIMGYCKFPVNALSLYLLESFADLEPSRANEISSIPWYCEIEAHNHCDGISQCLSDECSCENTTVETFFCPNHTGCITFPQLCDGVSDCYDGADECLCEDFVKIDCPTINSSVCVSKDEFCKIKQALPGNFTCNFPYVEDLNCTDINQQKEFKGNPLLECIEKHDWILRTNLTSFRDSCKTNCSDVENFVGEKWYKFCDKITTVAFQTDYEFLCVSGDISRQTCNIKKLCDGTADCTNGADEVECPGRFYCYLNHTESMEWVTEDKLCDGNKHCSNGGDECDPSCFSGRSSNNLIRSNILFYFITITGATIVIINAIVGIKCFKKNPSTSAGKVDRFLCLQVLFFDWMMGPYSCGIVVATMILQSRGSYCPQDEQWRSSIYCQVLGMIFSVASHGSLSAIALMSVVRCINCVKMHTQIKLRTIIIASTILITINVVNAFIPLLPIVAVRDIFRTEVFYKNFVDNPFLKSNLVNVTRLNEMHKTYYSNETDIYTTIKNLNNITSNDAIFDIVEVGYYGNTPLCVHNVFKEQQSYLIYKLFYLAVLSLLLILVTFTYVVIVRKQILSQRNVGSIGNGANRQNARSPSLAVKVSLMIGTQLASWLTYIGVAVFFHVSKGSPSEEIFEVLALIALPINSLLNPIFYSELYKKINTITSFQLRRFSRVLTKRLQRESTVSIEMGGI